MREKQRGTTMNLKKILATLGLAASLAGCGATNTDAVRYERGGVTYIIQHATGMSIPEYDWRRAQRRSINFAQDHRLPEGIGTTGHLQADGMPYQNGDTGPRYDAVLWTADTNDDDKPDLMRLIVNTQITTAPDIRAVGQSIHTRVLVQDVNYDGNADRGWIDNHDRQGGRDPDGVYDELEMLESSTMQGLIDNLIWYPRQTQEEAPTSAKM